MKFIDKIKLNCGLLFRSIFYAMKAGDNEITQTSNGINDSEINHHLTIGGVMNDLLAQEETEQVKEIRDEYYRILNEADKYHVDVAFSLDDNGEIVGDMSASSRKKTAAEYSRHVEVHKVEGEEIRVIQDARQIEKKSLFSVGADIAKMAFDPFDYFTIFDLDWDKITPRFPVDKFITKVVVKTTNNKEWFVELYFPTIAGQFTKLDALFISELNKLFNDKDYKSDIRNLNGLKFITDKAWNCDSLCEFEFTNMKFSDILVYDGSFVVKYSAKNVKDGVSVTEKYKTEQLTEKYKNKAPKKDATDIFAIDRQINGIDFGNKRLIITDENSN